MLAVYNVLGREVLRLESGSVPAGRHRYVVDASHAPERRLCVSTQNAGILTIPTNDAAEVTT